MLAGWHLLYHSINHMRHLGRPITLDRHKGLTKRDSGASRRERNLENNERSQSRYVMTLSPATACWPHDGHTSHIHPEWPTKSTLTACFCLSSPLHGYTLLGPLEAEN